MAEMTPMMRQYHRIKRENPDSILFFRLGDFYEMFEQDAKIVSSILNLTLTKRHNIPMCGLPYHAAHNYISRLLKAGRKIAICEQTALPEKGRGIAERKIVEIITPGTVTDEDFLDSSSNNYLLAMGRCADNLSMAWIDVSTGAFFASKTEWPRRGEWFRRELARLHPRELLIQESLIEDDNVIAGILDSRDDLMINRYPDWSFDLAASYKALCTQFGVSNLKGFGIADNDPVVYTTGVLLEYLNDTAKGLIPHVRSIKTVTADQYLGLDESTLKNLEILKNLQDGTEKYTLYSILNHTRTSMGARKLKRWLQQPLIDREAIEARYDRVEILYHNQMKLSSLRSILAGILDLERLASRIAMDRAHAKDLLAVGNSLAGVLQLNELLNDDETGSVLTGLETAMRNSVAELSDFISRSICEEPSVLLTEGKLIRAGYDRELDSLKTMRSNRKALLDEYLANEKQKTGISNLKVRYNKIIGYFLEVTKSNVDQVPEYYYRRQSLVGSERYTTEELGELENRLNSASEEAVEKEKQLFLSVRNRVKQHTELIMRTADLIAELDVIASFAQAATVRGYTRPVLREGRALSIRGGRHPVVEANLPGGSFIPNDLDLDADAVAFALITGPNMAGKSTYLRQVALIILMAQCGAYIPAASAEIGLVDRIFCRVGANDNLARGESTFLVEMNETANILRSATRDSLVIMDEVGRGTSTVDGLSIAWAVSEFLLNSLSVRTLFATHYHEITLLQHPKVKNLSLGVREENGTIVFLKRIEDGPAGSSYGLHAARLAGLPEEVLKRAAEIQVQFLEQEQLSLPETSREPARAPAQADLFLPSEMVVNTLKSLDPDNLTPLEALQTLYRLKTELQGS